MRKFKLTKIIASTLVIASVLVLNPIKASAEWRIDNNGTWYSEGNSWLTGWHPINGSFYYFNTNGYMATNSSIDGMQLGSDGKCQIINNTNTNKSATKILPYEISVSYASDCNQIYTNTSDSKFTMSGIDYTEGFTLYRSAYALFNLGEKYDNIQFKVGHVDSSSDHDMILTIYLDGKESKQMKLKCDDVSKLITIPVNKASQMKFEITDSNNEVWDTRYGFSNIIGY